MPDNLLEDNRAWAARVKAEDPTFFDRLAEGQHPRFLWVGCADSRVPESEIVGRLPGELFVHRNVANVAVASDLNFLAVLQYAVDVLKVEHVIVCGHYRCGGVQAALAEHRAGLVDHWLNHVREVRSMFADRLAEIADERERWDAMCELNAVAQVVHVAKSLVVRDCWDRGQSLELHGWVFDLASGELKKISDPIASAGAIDETARRAYEGALASRDV